MKNTENGNFRLYTNSGLGIGGTILMVLLIVIIIYLYQYGGGGIGGLICCGSMAVLWLAGCFAPPNGMPTLSLRRKD